MRDAGSPQLLIERLHLLGRDALIGLSEEPKQRVLDAHGAVERRAGAAKVVRQADVEWGEGRTKEALTPYGLARSM